MEKQMECTRGIVTNNMGLAFYALKTKEKQEKDVRKTNKCRENKEYWRMR